MAHAQLEAVIHYLRCLAATESTADQSDGALLRSFVVGNDQAAFTALVRRRGPLVLAVCRRVLQHAQDAEDTFQATFLLLAQNAATLCKQESLAGWLHGAAWRMAKNAHRMRFRRQRHERRARTMSIPNPEWSAMWRDVQAVLDEEIQGLPAPYRDTFILCCLENQSGAEAARQLGIKEGTVKSRLSKARALLQKALLRRGISLSAVLAAAALISDGAKAAVSGRLIISTASTAAGVAAGKQVAMGTVSANVFALLKGAKTTMIAAKLKIAVALALAFGGAGIGLNLLKPAWGQQEQGQQRVPVPTQSTRVSSSAKARTEREQTVEVTGPGAKVGRDAKGGATGRVLDPDGKPVAGATVYRSHPKPGLEADWRDQFVRGTKAAVPLTRTGPDGSFRLSPGEVKAARDPSAQIVAMAEGYGPGFLEPAGGNAAPVLRLARDDVPIRGRVIDIRGRPVAGATIQLVGILRPISGTLDAWLDTLKRERSAYKAESRMLRSWSGDDVRSVFPALVADREGGFTLKGVGRERIAVLRVEGPGIETSYEYVATRDMPAVKVPLDEGSAARFRDVVFHGAAPMLAAGPGLEIVGTVRDKDSGRPLAGITVQTVASLGNPPRYDLKATTDARGNYRLSGIPLKDVFGYDQKLLAISEEGPPYVGSLEHVGDVPGPASVRKDFALKRGAWARGRVIDRSTGRAVPAHLDYFILEDNPHVKDYPKYGPYLGGLFRTDENGEFQIVVIPGRGILTAQSLGPYRMGAGLENIKGLHSRGLAPVPALPKPIRPTDFHALVEIDPRPGEESVTVEIGLDRGRTLKGKIVGPDGEPVAGALMMGAEDGLFPPWSELPTAEFEVHALGTQRKRGLLFYHEAKHLAGAYMVKPDEAGPLTVKLEPCGTWSGRLVDRNGLPQAGALLICYRTILGEDLEDLDRTLDKGALPSSIRTDKDGRFRLSGLVPGLKYSLTVFKDGRYAGMVAADVTTRAGEVKELGDFTAE